MPNDWEKQQMFVLAELSRCHQNYENLVKKIDDNHEKLSLKFDALAISVVKLRAQAGIIGAIAGGLLTFLIDQLK